MAVGFVSCIVTGVTVNLTCLFHSMQFWSYFLRSIEAIYLQRGCVAGTHFEFQKVEPRINSVPVLLLAYSPTVLKLYSCS